MSGSSGYSGRAELPHQTVKILRAFAEGGIAVNSRQAIRATVVLVAALLFAFSSFGSGKASAQDHAHKTEANQKKVSKSMSLRIPESLKKEHDELHSELARATQAGGRVGEAAKVVAELLHPHFLKEEEYALPPLGLLRELAEGRRPSEAADVLAITDKLKAELPEMLQEHRTIVAALGKLIDAAKQENKIEHAHFAEKLMLHAQTEEEILYPTAVLIGEYLKMKSR